MRNGSYINFWKILQSKKLSNDGSFFNDPVWCWNWLSATWKWPTIHLVQVICSYMEIAVRWIAVKWSVSHTTPYCTVCNRDPPDRQQPGVTTSVTTTDCLWLKHFTVLRTGLCGKRLLWLKGYMHWLTGCCTVARWMWTMDEKTWQYLSNLFDNTFNSVKSKETLTNQKSGNRSIVQRR